MDKDKLTNAVAGFQHGNANAFNTIYELTNGSLYVYARSLMSDQAQAEDLLQNTYLQILQSIGSLRDPGAFLSWSKRIMHNQYVDQYRGSSSETTASSEEALLMFDEMIEEDRSVLPEENYDAKEVAGIVWDVMDQLPPDQRTVMLAFYMDEMSVAEIADMLDIPEGTVKTRLHYGRKAMRRDIENYEKKHGIKLHSLVPGPIISMALKYHMPANMAMSHGQAASLLGRITESAAGHAASAGKAAAASHGAKAGAAAGAKTGAATVAGIGGGKLVAIAVAAVLVIGGAGYGIFHSMSETPDNNPQDTAIEETAQEDQAIDETQWTELTDDDYSLLIEGGFNKGDTANILAVTDLYGHDEEAQGVTREAIEESYGPYNGYHDIFVSGLLCPEMTYDTRGESMMCTIPLTWINRYRGFWGLEPYSANSEYIDGIKWTDDTYLYLGDGGWGPLGDPESTIIRAEYRGDEMRIEFSYTAASQWESIDFGPYVANFRKNAEGHYALYDIEPLR